MNADDVMTRAAEPPDAVLRYAPHDDGLIDVHLPAGDARPRPLVVYVHGGFWRQQWDRKHGRPLANALASEGYVVALPEYRRVGGGGGWPTTAEDLDAALTALPGLLAGIGVASTTTTLVGHSAGGHLVLWLANQPHPVDRVVALAPVGNLRKAAEYGMGEGATVDFLGGTPDTVPEVYDAADPATRMRERPSCDVVVIHGDRDDAVPVESSRGLKARFDWLDYRELPGVDHFAVIDPLSDAWPVVLDVISSTGVDPPGGTLET
ncbi:MAG: alpha/beta hydrolase family protein [Nocardioidaceae bacterium]